MRKLFQQLKKWWAVIGIALSVLANVAMGAYAWGKQSQSGTDEFNHLRTAVNQHIVTDEADNIKLNQRVATLETTTADLPRILREMEKRLGNVEGNTSAIMGMLQRSRGNERCGPPRPPELLRGQADRLKTGPQKGDSLPRGIKAGCLKTIGL